MPSDPPSDTDRERPEQARSARLPSRRWSAALAGAMLAVGLVVGAAIGPSPSPSDAGVARSLPLLIAELQARHRASAPASTPPAPQTSPEPSPSEPAPTTTQAHSAAGEAAQPASTSPSEESAASETTKGSSAPKSKLPQITSVWLIQLDGTSFEAAAAQQASAPYIDTQLIPASTLLPSWSGLDGNAFAADVAVAEAPAPGAAPPILHTIVQPPCPEGAAGTACAPETPGQLATADAFLKSTLATITNSSLFREHGLVVVTFGSVGIAAQSELPAGTSTSELTYQPAAGVVLLSPFAKAGQRSSTAYNTTSPRQSLEKLLH